jgi:hypothetical protein
MEDNLNIFENGRGCASVLKFCMEFKITKKNKIWGAIFSIFFTVRMGLS